MARFKNHLLVVVGFAIAGLIGAAFGTGTAQAVVSTLVSVVNPGTSPVHTSSVDDPGRIGYQATATNAGCTGSICSVSFPSVAAGHRVVVQHIAALANFPQGDPAPADTFAFVSSANFIFITSFVASAIPSGPFAVFDQPVLFYVDSGDQATVEVIGNGSTLFALRMTMTGYELDCTVAACAPIATQ